MFGRGVGFIMAGGDKRITDNYDVSKIRNFCIIAHIDHGKSTLADRMLEITGTIDKRQMREQFLDMMDLERERGITIKAQPVRMEWKSHVLNLIDTPGHVDFSYEVSRALKACEGAVLLVDATQGVQAQTVANLFLALEEDLEIIPVINKIDLPNARPDEVEDEIKQLIGDVEVLRVSAKTGEGVERLLDEIIAKIPAPAKFKDDKLRILIFDSKFDSYRGVVSYIRVFSGEVKEGDVIKICSTGSEYEVQEVGVFTPNFKKTASLRRGEVGYIMANIKNVSEVRVGDTITLAVDPVNEPLEGFRILPPVVFAGIYPIYSDDYEKLREALAKLKLNDASLVYEPETSVALGFGFRCGFLGLLHMDIVKERLEREFDLELIVTVPSVKYRVVVAGREIEVKNPAEFPENVKIDAVYEPYIRAQIFVPSEFVGAVMELCQQKRGNMITMDYITPERVQLIYELPLAEILVDFYDKLKAKTRGYASFEYEPVGYKESDLVKVNILVNGDEVDALSFIVHRDTAYYRARAMVTKLKEVIPRQLFEVAIQAAIGKKVIARATVKALRKDVLAKCYGGDVTRKKKLLEKQKEGKKRMKEIGKVSIPQEAFLSVLKIED